MIYKHKKKLISAVLLSIFIIIQISISGCSVDIGMDSGESNGGRPNINQPRDNQLAVHFIDVGQGDSILIQTPAGEYMLIDAGPNAQGANVVKYLKELGINKIDVLVGTHPHEDHIGGLDDVINNFDIGSMYMPKVAHTTKTYSDVLKAAKSKGIKIKSAKQGLDIPMEGIQASILSPSEGVNPKDLNGYSAVIRVVYKDTAFLFQGDAERDAENNILGSGLNIKSDVIKIGHHGSKYATGAKFLSAVNPKYAVISVGKDNDYGHPHKKTMELLNKENIPVYRTDQCGSIVAISDGNSISFDCKPGNYSYGDK